MLNAQWQERIELLKTEHLQTEMSLLFFSMIDKLGIEPVPELLLDNGTSVFDTGCIIKSWKHSGNNVVFILWK